MLPCGGLIYTSMLLMLLGASESVSVEPKMGLMLGFRGGLSVGSYWGDGITKFERDLTQSVNNLEPHMLLFFTSSFFLEYELVPDFLALQPELIYMRMGKTWNTFLDNQNRISFKTYTDYLNIPVNIKLLVPLNPVVLSVYTGPSVFFKLQSRAENIANFPPDVNKGFLGSLGNDEQISKRVNPLDIGLSTGFAIDYLIGTSRLVFDLKYIFGFLNVYKSKEAKDIRNSYFSLTAGYGWSY